jgi:uncharacterized integral membrane protein
MSFFKAVRLILGVAIVLVIIFFVVKNPDQRVDINLVFFPTKENVLLIEVLFYTLVIGFVGGLTVALMKIVELEARLRAAKRSRHRIEGELTTLRNLPLEEPEERPAEPGESTG